MNTATNARKGNHKVCKSQKARVTRAHTYI
jgi:hypothetical protein